MLKSGTGQLTAAFQIPREERWRESRWEAGLEEEKIMPCVMGETGAVNPAAVQAGLHVGTGRLRVPVQAEAGAQCGETDDSAEPLHHQEKGKVAVTPKAIALHSVESVYRVSAV